MRREQSNCGVFMGRSRLRRNVIASGIITGCNGAVQLLYGGGQTTRRMGMACTVIQFCMTVLIHSHRACALASHTTGPTQTYWVGGRGHANTSRPRAIGASTMREQSTKGKPECTKGNFGCAKRTHRAHKEYASIPWFHPRFHLFCNCIKPANTGKQS